MNARSFLLALVTLVCCQFTAADVKADDPITEAELLRRWAEEAGGQENVGEMASRLYASATEAMNPAARPPVEVDLFDAVDAYERKHGVRITTNDQMRHAIWEAGNGSVSGSFTGHETRILPNGKILSTHIDVDWHGDGQGFPRKAMHGGGNPSVNNPGGTAEALAILEAHRAGRRSVDIGGRHYYWQKGKHSIRFRIRGMGGAPPVAMVGLAPAIWLTKRYPRFAAGTARVAGGMTKGAVGVAQAVAVDWADESMAEAMGLDVEKVKQETLMELFGGIPGHMTIAAGFNAWDNYWYDPDVRDMSGNKVFRSLVTHGHGPDFYAPAKEMALKLMPGQESKSDFGDVYLSEEQRNFANDLSQRASAMYRRREEIRELQKPTALPWYQRMFAW